MHDYRLELYYLETFIIFTFEQFVSFRMYVLRVLFSGGGSSSSHSGIGSIHFQKI